MVADTVARRTISLLFDTQNLQIGLFFINYSMMTTRNIFMEDVDGKNGEHNDGRNVIS